MGREIERMDRELEQLRTEITELDNSRFTGGVQMKSLKSHKI